MPRPAISPRTQALARLLANPSLDDVRALNFALLAAADAHGVTPLLGQALRDADLLDEVTLEVRSQLSRARREAFLIDAVSRDHAARTLSDLAAAGIEAVVFKGAALAETHYSATWLRPRGDVDLLVHPSQAAAAGAVLERVGCQKALRPEGAIVTSQSRYIGTAAAMEVTYDLHWRLTEPHAFARCLDYDAVEAAAVQGRAPSERLAAPVHALLIACVHRAAHHQDTDRLLFLCDIDRLAKRFSDDEWNDFVDLAARSSVCAVCARGLDLAATLLDTPVPAWVGQALDSRGTEEASASFAEGPMSRIDILRSDLATLGWRDGATLLCQHMFPRREYVAALYGNNHALLLPFLYAHRLVSGLSAWLRRAEYTDPPAS